ncbi:MAG: hypothetical protein DCF32_03115 [Leptolyngbya sp.]|nr:MAG: hypothetical protein DCF32_03115 [Leptolyngbya sp.]
MHSTRKRLKKGRSVLRLVRKSIGENTYRRENNQLRSTSQALAPARDSVVYKKNFNDLIDWTVRSSPALSLGEG